VPIVRGGRTVYGYALGILMLETRFPRLPGDVGHAATWPFPVRYEVVPGATSSRVLAPEPDDALLEPFVASARRLEAEGVRAITTSCGFLSVFQSELSAAVSVPVLTSALLQVPLASRLIGPGRRVAILTERPNLTERHFAGAGWSTSDVPVVIRALPADAVFPTVYADDGVEADPEVLETELATTARDLVREHPDVGAIVLECTNFVPFAHVVRHRSGLPVFDLYTLVVASHEATVGRTFPRDEW
jgi:Asp/Glu/hydantoin racemase